jgi:integrase/recombinase XerC
MPYTRRENGRFASTTPDDLEAQRRAKQAEIQARGGEQKGRTMLTLDPTFEKYVTELRDAKHRDPKTVTRNEQALVRLTGWLRSEGIEATEADRWALNRYFGSLRDSLAPSTLGTELTIVKAAYRFAHEDLGLIPEVPRITFETGDNGNGKEIKTYSNEELRRVRAAIMDELEELIFYGLAYAGLRRHELCGLTWGSVDLENRQLAVVGKGNKGRRVPIHPMLWKLLKERHRGQSEDALVLGEGGSARNLNHRLGALLKRAGVDGGNRPAHAFRKTVASVLTEEGAKTNDIDKIMGWSPPNVRERYYTRTSPNLYATICLLYRSDPIEQKPAALVAVA